jgi:hypothetical protein
VLVIANPLLYLIRKNYQVSIVTKESLNGMKQSICNPGEIASPCSAGLAMTIDKNFPEKR